VGAGGGIDGPLDLGERLLGLGDRAPTELADRCLRRKQLVDRDRRAEPSAAYHGAMLLRPLRRAPMMLGGVGFQAGLDEARRKQLERQRRAAVRTTSAPVTPASDVVQQLKDLKALLDDGVLTPEEFQLAKRQVLAR
jgi:putative oligomerization/nucleic acid binding protein